MTKDVDYLSAMHRHALIAELEMLPSKRKQLDSNLFGLNHLKLCVPLKSVPMFQLG
jgi:hypothetical protein